MTLCVECVKRHKCLLCQSDDTKTTDCTDDKAATETRDASETTSTEVLCDATEETAGRQAKPKKLSKKQLLAEQRRKDRVCEQFLLWSFVYSNTQ